MKCDKCSIAKWNTIGTIKVKCTSTVFCIYEEAEDEPTARDKGSLPQ